MAGNITMPKRLQAQGRVEIMGDGDGTGNSISAAGTEYTDEFYLSHQDQFSVEIIVTSGTANFDAFIQFDVDGTWVDNAATGSNNGTVSSSCVIVTSETNDYVIADVTIPFWRGKMRIGINNDDGSAAEFIVRISARSSR